MDDLGSEFESLLPAPDLWDSVGIDKNYDNPVGDSLSCGFKIRCDIILRLHEKDCSISGENERSSDEVESGSGGVGKWRLRQRVRGRGGWFKYFSSPCPISGGEAAWPTTDYGEPTWSVNLLTYIVLQARDARSLSLKIVTTRRAQQPLGGVDPHTQRLFINQ